MIAETLQLTAPQDLEQLLMELLEMELCQDLEINRKAIQQALNEKLYTKQEILARAVELLLA